MKTDKEFALDILGWLELYTVRISILEHLLKHSDVKDWKEQAMQMSAKAAPREIVHLEFGPWHEAILNSPDITTVAAEIVKSLSSEWPGN
jgi:hypothetical protein